MLFARQSKYKNILLVIFLAVLVGGSWYLLSQPAAPREEGWQMFTDDVRGISFQYPEALAAEYISATDWPPQIQILDAPFACTDAGEESMLAGRTEKRMVDGRTYCVTTRTEGAAGSIYSLYAYAFAEGEETIILTFGVQRPQCGNYSEPERIACEAEREAFDLDSLIDRIADTLSRS